MFDKYVLRGETTKKKKFIYANWYFGGGRILFVKINQRKKHEERKTHINRYSANRSNEYIIARYQSILDGT